MKKILMSLLVIALMLGVIGAAFTGPIAGWSNVGILSRGGTYLPTVGVDHMSYITSSGVEKPAALVGVTLSFTEKLTNPMIFISARSAPGVGTELAYYAGEISGTILRGDNTTFYLYDTASPNCQYPNCVVDHPDLSEVNYVEVTVADNGSQYNTP